MALSATFTANFSSFYDAVDKAEVKLKDFGAGAEKAGARLNAMGNQFSGVKIVQDAALMVKAVEEIGGVSKLTEKELAKLGATANEAVAKMKALGMDVPKNLQKIADETKNANKAGIDWMGSLTKIAGAVGIAFSIDAVVGFVGSVFDAASAVKDLGNQWGFSTDAVQEWTGAARDSGISTEALGKSILFVNEKIEEGSKEYDALLKNIGLSGEAMRKLSQEDAYKIILEKITAITDQTLQYDVALGLLGPSAKQTIGGIRDGLVEATAAQDKMSKETIKALADAQDEWKKFTDNVVIYSGNMLRDVMKNSKALFSSWGNFLTIMGKGFKAQFTGGNDVKQFVDGLEAAAAASTGLANALVPVASHGDDVNKGLQTTSAVTAGVKKNTEGLAAAEAARKKGLEDAKRAEEAYTRELKKHDDALDDLVNSFGGAGGSGAIGKANDYIAALRMAIPIEQMSATAKLNIHKAMDEAIVSYQAAGRMAPKVMYDIWLATKNTTEGVVEFSSKWKNFADIVNTQPIDLGAGFEMFEAPSLAPLERFGTSIGRISLAMGEIGRMSGGTFGEIAEAIGGVAGGLDAGAKAAEDFDKAMKEFKPGGDTAKGIADVAAAGVVAAASFLQMTEGASILQSTLTGAAMGAGLAPGPYMAYGAAIGAVVGYIRGINNASGDTVSALNKMKFHIADAAGGWDALSVAAKNAGTSINDVLNAESPQDLQYATEKLGAALEYQATALDKVKEAAERYGITIEELGPAMQRQELDKQAQQLFYDYGILTKAGVDAAAVTDKMAESVNAYVSDALAMGQEVPIAMKPMLEQFAKSGQLLDENGDAITNLEDSGISFAMTMSDGFKAMIEEVKKLTDAIARGLGLAIEEIPQPVIRGRVEWESGATPDNVPRPNNRPGGGSAPEYARGTDGFVNFGRGTPVILHGWEAVVPRGDAASMATVTAGAGGGGGAVAASPIIINAQGAFFDTPGDLQRLASKVEDALNAKHGLTHRRRAS
jgi:hypothetical protein